MKTIKQGDMVVTKIGLALNSSSTLSTNSFLPVGEGSSVHCHIVSHFQQNVYWKPKLSLQEGWKYLKFQTCSRRNWLFFQRAFVLDRC